MYEPDFSTLLMAWYGGAVPKIRDFKVHRVDEVTLSCSWQEDAKLVWTKALRPTAERGWVFVHQEER